MKTLRTVLVLVVLVNVTAAAGFVFWLWATDRLSRDRVSRIAHILRPTTAQENAQAADAQAAQQDFGQVPPQADGWNLIHPQSDWAALPEARE